MFKKTKDSQLNIFSSPSALFSGRSQKIFEDKTAWHNTFRQQVTFRIDENLFKPLFCNNNGTPNASIRVLISMMVLKEAEGISDQKLFENCRFNMLTRSAIGLVNADDTVPADSTYYLLRKKITDYALNGNENLLETVFAQITKDQCIEFEVSGKSVRMDSKLLGSNIAYLSRYELVHETLRLFFNQVKKSGKIDPATNEILTEILKFEGNKIVYMCSGDEVKSRLHHLGVLIFKILPLFSEASSKHYKTLKRVFGEQFKITENNDVVTKNNDEISSKSVQSPHDTDCTYRNKDGNKVKGYSINITESCDDVGLNLIGNVDVRVSNISDVSFLQDDLSKIKEVFTDTTTAAHTDGAYHSLDNQSFCVENKIELHLHAIQGAKGKYQLEMTENGELSVVDIETNQIIDVQKIISKKGEVKWRIKYGNGYRYFTQENIDTYQIRKKIEQTPIEILQKRNNVEATIFQLGYHYPNAKSRYRGLIKHQIWANIRCLWVNFVRIVNYTVKKRRKSAITEVEILFLKSSLFIDAFGGFVQNKYSKNQLKFQYF
jgi:hypothetical protein